MLLGAALVYRDTYRIALLVSYQLTAVSSQPYPTLTGNCGDCTKVKTHHIVCAIPCPSLRVVVVGGGGGRGGRDYKRQMHKSPSLSFNVYASTYPVKKRCSCHRHIDFLCEHVQVTMVRGTWVPAGNRGSSTKVQNLYISDPTTYPHLLYIHAYLTL